MPIGADAEKMAAQGSMHSRDSLDGQKSFRVIIEDIASSVETIDSFAIKFSLLTKTPISKVKHIVHRLPAPIWCGPGRSRAEHILALIEEAGGKGNIVEVEGAAPASPATPVAPGEPAKPAKGKTTCRWCGFPMKAEETRCGFCMMAVGDVEKSERQPGARARTKRVSRKRLVFYAAVFAAGIVIIELLSR